MHFQIKSPNNKKGHDMSITRSTVLVATLVLAPVLVLAGCGGEDSDGGYGSAETGAGTPSESGVVGSDFGSQLGGVVDQATADLAKNYSEQAKQQQSQLDTLKASARSYDDQQLDGAIEQIETVLNQLTGKVDEIKNADQGTAAALQKEIQKLMGQAGDLFQQAQTRLTQLQKG